MEEPSGSVSTAGVALGCGIPPVARAWTWVRAGVGFPGILFSFRVQPRFSVFLLSLCIQERASPANDPISSKIPITKPAFESCVWVLSTWSIRVFVWVPNSEQIRQVSRRHFLPSLKTLCDARSDHDQKSQTDSNNLQMLLAQIAPVKWGFQLVGMLLLMLPGSPSWMITASTLQ